jgi:hypothetical protein
MVANNANVQIAKINYELLCDAKTLLGLAIVLYLLELVQGLYKLA